METGITLLTHSNINNVKAAELFLKQNSLKIKSPDFALLRQIVKNFSIFPYENISKIIKSRKSEGIDRLRLPQEVYSEHREYNFGGTCFSLTYYLKSILDISGYSSYPVLADMNWGKNVHCSLVVHIDSVKYLVDPGYLLTEPMEINPLKPRVYMNEFSGVELIFRQNQNIVELFTFNRNELKWRYRFRDEPADDEMFFKAWSDSFNWKTMKGICLNKIEKKTRIYIHNHFMREENFSGKKNYKIKNNLHIVVNERFGIDKHFVEEALTNVELIRGKHNQAE